MGKFKVFNCPACGEIESVKETHGDGSTTIRTDLTHNWMYRSFVLSEIRGDMPKHIKLLQDDIKTMEEFLGGKCLSKSEAHEMKRLISRINTAIKALEKVNEFM